MKQGDTLSPSLFLIVINLVLSSLDRSSVQGVIVKKAKKNVFAFADDLNLVARSKEHLVKLDKILRDFFDWSDCLKPADEKYSIAVFEKQNGKVSMVREDCAPMSYAFLADKGAEFKLLGKHYNCAGDANATMKAVKERIEAQLDRLDKDPLPGHLKTEVYKLGFGSFNRWALQVQHFNASWIETELRPMVIRYLKKWSGLARPGSSEIFFLPVEQMGAGLPDPLLLWKQASISRSCILLASPDPTIKACADERAEAKEGSFKEAQRLRSAHAGDKKKIQAELQKAHFKELKERLTALPQNGAALRDASSPETEPKEFPWLKSPARLHRKAFKFGLNALVDTCPVNYNLKKWSGGVRTGDECDLCGSKRETISHVLAECPAALASGPNDPKNRFSYRHNAILSSLAKAVRTEKPEWTVMTDLRHDEFTYQHAAAAPRPAHLEMLGTLRPDLVLTNEREVILAELTSPMEHNMERRNKDKTARYESLRLPAGDNGRLYKFPFEIGARGGINGSLKKLLDHIGLQGHQYREVRDHLSRTALRCSAEIFSHKGVRDWVPQQF